MRTLRFLTFFVLFLSARAATPAEKFQLDSSHSKIGFTATLAGVSDVEGRFVDVDAAIMYDESDLTKSTITAIIKSASVDTADENRDRDLKAPVFFDATKFPTIHFQSSRVEKRGEAWVLIGPLTIRDVTKVVEIPFVWRQKAAPDIWGNRRISFDGHLTLNRKDFGVIGIPFWNNAISNAIQIDLKISAEIPNYGNWGFSAPEGKKSIGKAIFELVNQDGAEAALRQYDEFAKDTATYELGPRQLNVAGRKLLQNGKKKDALAIFRRNTELYPTFANGYNALGDALVENGDRAGAVRAFQRAVELDPNHTLAIESLRSLAN